MTTQLSQDFVNTSLSHATMRTDDLYSAFMPFLAEYDLTAWNTIQENYADVIAELNSAIEENNSFCGTEYIKDEEFLIESLFNALNNISPENCYFGAHPGDGSDYGFWQLEESYI